MKKKEFKNKNLTHNVTDFNFTIAGSSYVESSEASSLTNANSNLSIINKLKNNDENINLSNIDLKYFTRSQTNHQANNVNQTINNIHNNKKQNTKRKPYFIQTLENEDENLHQIKKTTKSKKKTKIKAKHNKSKENTNKNKLESDSCKSTTKTDDDISINLSTSNSITNALRTPVKQILHPCTNLSPLVGNDHTVYEMQSGKTRKSIVFSFNDSHMVKETTLVGKSSDEAAIDIVKSNNKNNTRTTPSKRIAYTMMLSAEPSNSIVNITNNNSRLSAISSEFSFDLNIGETNDKLSSCLSSGSIIKDNSLLSNNYLDRSLKDLSNHQSIYNNNNNNTNTNDIQESDIISTSQCLNDSNNIVFSLANNTLLQSSDTNNNNNTNNSLHNTTDIVCNTNDPVIINWNTVPLQDNNEEDIDHHHSSINNKTCTIDKTIILNQDIATSYDNLSNNTINNTMQSVLDNNYYYGDNEDIQLSNTTTNYVIESSANNSNIQILSTIDLVNNTKQKKKKSDKKQSENNKDSNSYSMSHGDNGTNSISGNQSRYNLRTRRHSPTDDNVSSILPSKISTNTMDQISTNTIDQISTNTMDQLITNTSSNEEFDEDSRLYYPLESISNIEIDVRTFAPNNSINCIIPLFPIAKVENLEKIPHFSILDLTHRISNISCQQYMRPSVPFNITNDYDNNDNTSNDNNDDQLNLSSQLANQQINTIDQSKSFNITNDNSQLNIYNFTSKIPILKPKMSEYNKTNENPINNSLTLLSDYKDNTIIDNSVLTIVSSMDNSNHLSFLPSNIITHDHTITMVNESAYNINNNIYEYQDSWKMLSKKINEASENENLDKTIEISSMSNLSEYQSNYEVIKSKNNNEMSMDEHVSESVLKMKNNLVNSNRESKNISTFECCQTNYNNDILNNNYKISLDKTLGSIYSTEEDHEILPEKIVGLSKVNITIDAGNKNKEDNKNNVTDYSIESRNISTFQYSETNYNNDTMNNINIISLDKTLESFYSNEEDIEILLEKIGELSEINVTVDYGNRNKEDNNKYEPKSFGQINNNLVDYSIESKNLSTFEYYKTNYNNDTMNNTKTLESFYSTDNSCRNKSLLQDNNLVDYSVESEYNKPFLEDTQILTTKIDRLSKVNVALDHGNRDGEDSIKDIAESLLKTKDYLVNYSVDSDHNRTFLEHTQILPMKIYELSKSNFTINNDKAILKESNTSVNEQVGQSLLDQNKMCQDITNQHESNVISLVDLNKIINLSSERLVLCNPNLQIRLDCSVRDMLIIINQENSQRNTNDKQMEVGETTEKIIYADNGTQTEKTANLTKWLPKRVCIETQCDLSHNNDYTSSTNNQKVTNIYSPDTKHGNTIKDLATSNRLMMSRQDINDIESTDIGLIEPNNSLIFANASLHKDTRNLSKLNNPDQKSQISGQLDNNCDNNDKENIYSYFESSRLKNNEVKRKISLSDISCIEDRKYISKDEDSQTMVDCDDVYLTDDTDKSSSQASSIQLNEKISIMKKKFDVITEESSEFDQRSVEKSDQHLSCVRSVFLNEVDVDNTTDNKYHYKNKFIFPSPIPKYKGHSKILQGDIGSDISFDEGFTTFIKIEKKAKNNKSFILPTDSIRTFEGIHKRSPGKRTLAKPALRPNEQIIYKNGLIDHRRRCPSPATVKRRTQLYNPTNKQKSIKQNTKMVGLSYMDLQQYIESPDGENVTYIDPITNETIRRKLVFMVEEYYDSGLSRNEKLSIAKKSFSKKIVNDQCDSKLELFPSKKTLTAIVVIDECKLKLLPQQMIIIPQGVSFFIYNPNCQILNIIHTISLGKK